ncbi:DUF1178 family protein [Paracoccus zhejiangensis]|uniref:DUF1178 domain-containing protein n=1 Tax=Paracoccus zhejiangensis TaxID=1077935 RepID=A0A2H5F1F9_9RHOB|nr:DUF1178 family protein [Paracoccus zhejiangensis]AUH65399.1 DUF1178 domain-containing protein [Paracoccus zhejiangensis]
MIRYALRCKEGHDFEGWFRSSEGFETLRAASQVNCTICGGSDVSKALMAPAVPAERKGGATAPSLDQPQGDREAMLAKLREHVETTSDYVGLRFADEARAMHEGRSETRSIHGEARPEEARKLIEDGVPIAPLPFIPKQKAN